MFCSDKEMKPLQRAQSILLAIPTKCGTTSWLSLCVIGTSQGVAIIHIRERGDEQRNPVGSVTFRQRGAFLSTVDNHCGEPDNLLLTASLAWRDKLPPIMDCVCRSACRLPFPSCLAGTVNGKLVVDKWLTAT